MEYLVFQSNVGTDWLILEVTHSDGVYFEIRRGITYNSETKKTGTVLAKRAKILHAADLIRYEITSEEFHTLYTNLILVRDFLIDR